MLSTFSFQTATGDTITSSDLLAADAKAAADNAQCKADITTLDKQCKADIAFLDTKLDSTTDSLNALDKQRKTDIAAFETKLDRTTIALNALDQKCSDRVTALEKVVDFLQVLMAEASTMLIIALAGDCCFCATLSIISRPYPCCRFASLCSCIRPDLSPYLALPCLCRQCLQCPAGEYEVAAPTLSPPAPRGCKPLTPACSGSTYEKVPPTKTSDRVCAAISTDPCPSGSWMVFQATPFFPQRCLSLTSCTSLQYEERVRPDCQSLACSGA